MAAGKLGKFHRVCGKNIELSEGDTVAERVRSFNYGVVYTEQPVPVGTVFQIRLLGIRSEYWGSLSLGFTTVRPNKGTIPSNVHSGKKNYWMLNYKGHIYDSATGQYEQPYSVVIEEIHKSGLLLGCMVNKKRDLHYFVDGKDRGLACTGLPTDQPLWGVADVYANTTKIKSEFHISLKEKCSNCLQLEQQLREEQSCVRGLQQRLDEAAQQLQQQREVVAQQREEAAAREQESQLQLQLLQQRLDTATAELQQLCSSPQVASQQGIEAWKVPRGEIQILGEMDRGAWGVVARGRFQGQLVAVKWPHPAILNEHTTERLRREVRIMSQVRHPNLLRFIAAVFDNQMPRLPPMIVMELLNTNLRTAYQNGRLVGNNKIPIFQDVAYALHYLHEHQEPIIHRDMSAPNVLLEELPNQMWRAKVSDFGSANLAKMAQTMGEGAIIYAAPETIPQAYDSDDTPPPQTTKIDVYSYGVLLCEVITCQFPDPAQYRSMLRQIQSQWQFMHELIVHCTKRNPEERPTMAQVLDKLNKLPNPRSQQRS